MLILKGLMMKSVIYAVLIMFGLYSVSLGEKFGVEVKSLSADFIQTIQNQSVQYQGSFELKSPNLAKWEYKFPLKKIIYINQDKLISYEPMLSQAIYKKVSTELDFLSILQNAKPSKNDSNLYFSTIGATTYELLFENKLPKTIRYEDTLGNQVIIELSNVKLNPLLKDEIFIFNPPKGIDIIQ